MHRSVLSSTLRCRWGASLLGLLVLLVGLAASGRPSRAAATAPVDSRSTAPDHPAEIAGAGYLLSDPGHGAHWVGAYRTINGLKAYCVDRFYDYPDPSYGYRTSEVSRWPGRRGSNSGASGHTAQRIIWIVNSYGQSPSAATDAAVSVAISRLNGSAAFEHSYQTYFKRQLTAINPAIVSQVDRLLADSDQFAGPYTTRITFGVAPAVGGEGYFGVSVRSAKGFPTRNAGYRVTAIRGGLLRSRATGTTGPSGVARVQYTALGAGLVSATAIGTAPNVTMRLGYSPTHSTQDFRTGSQRVAVISSSPLKAVSPGSGRVIVLPPAVTTRVADGNGPRAVGALVSDQVVASGLVPLGGYSLVATLLDTSGLTCGTTTMDVVADRLGTVSAVTRPIAVCGGGTNTFVERIRDRSGRLLVETPPGQPTETFPVTPAVATAVVGGTGGRAVATPVADEVTGNGLLPNATYRLDAVLQDSSGQSCGMVSTSVTADAHGEFRMTTAPIRACGSTTNTFVERLTDAAGVVVAMTPPGQPSESFPLLLTGPAVPPRPVASHIHPPAHTPIGKPAVPVKVAVVRPFKPAPVPAPMLAATGGAPGAGLLAGAVLLGLGAVILAGMRRRVR